MLCVVLCSRQGRYHALLVTALVIIAAVVGFWWWQQSGTDFQKGVEAYERGDYKQAESHLRAGLDDAKFGPNDPRLATSLNNLAEIYRVQGRYAEAEPFYHRSLAIWEKA